MWILCSQELPPNGQMVLTKIHDKDGLRNQQILKRQNHLWFTGGSNNTYVYYEPTHWWKDRGELK